MLLALPTGGEVLAEELPDCIIYKAFNTIGGWAGGLCGRICCVGDRPSSLASMSLEPTVACST